MHLIARVLGVLHPLHSFEVKTYVFCTMREKRLINAKHITKNVKQIGTKAETDTIETKGGESAAEAAATNDAKESEVVVAAMKNAKEEEAQAESKKEQRTLR